MGIITSDYVDKYFEQRPQLKKPENQQGMYRLEQEWVPLVRSLIAIAERPCNTQMQIDAKPCEMCERVRLNVYYLDKNKNYCINCGRALHD